MSVDNFAEAFDDFERRDLPSAAVHVEYPQTPGGIVGDETRRRCLHSERGEYLGVERLPPYEGVFHHRGCLANDAFGVTKAPEGDGSLERLDEQLNAPRPSIALAEVAAQRRLLIGLLGCLAVRACHELSRIRESTIRAQAQYARRMRAGLESRIDTAKDEILPPDADAIAVVQASRRYDGDAIDTHTVPTSEIFDDSSLVVDCNSRMLA
jgi:hypothetical protein